MKLRVGAWYKLKNKTVVQCTGVWDYNGNQTNNLDKASTWVIGGLHYYADGRMTGTNLADPTSVDCEVEVVEKRPKSGSFWMNVYALGAEYWSFTHVSKAKADEVCDGDRIACVEVKWEEGQGL